MRHHCSFDAPADSYGAAIDYCTEHNEELWVGNGEYSSRVNFCPWCGFEAKKKVKPGDPNPYVENHIKWANTPRDPDALGYRLSGNCGGADSWIVSLKSIESSETPK